MRDAYLEAADSAVTLLRDPAVAARWADPSALEGFTVGGLAEHLAQQLFNVSRALAAPLPDDAERIVLLEHYTRVPWLGEPLDSAANTAIREGGESAAAEGPAALLSRVDTELAALRTALPAVSVEHVLLPWTGWALTLDDLLVTRMMEIAVHSDDLAVSVDVPTPALPPQVLGPVVALLTSLAVHTHGPTALLRALTRRERAPESIVVF
jgi:hypothetical protein